MEKYENVMAISGQISQLGPEIIEHHQKMQVKSESTEYYYKDEHNLANYLAPYFQNVVVIERYENSMAIIWLWLSLCSHGIPTAVFNGVSLGS